jgi:nicotinamidase/pyrazinamidase
MSKINRNNLMKALILVDIQNDFSLPFGALSVPKGEEVVSVANRLLESNIADIVVATADWHPANHKSFRANNDVPADEIVGTLNEVPQVWWPNHCVQGTNGAEFHRDLNMNKVAAIFRKGMNPQVDSYSGLFDNKAIFDGKETRTPTGLASYLSGRGVTDVFVLGLATDYCVKFTALDAAALGFSTHLIVDGCRAVNLGTNDGENAVSEMQAAGIKVINSGELL